MRIILASQSLLRRKALDILGLKYKIKPSNVNEKAIRDSNPMVLAKKLAEIKALEAGKSEVDAIIISGDLFVVFNDTIYEKPKDKKEAINMLKAFSGNKLEIVAGIAVYNTETKKILSASDTFSVKFRNLLDYEIEDYVSRYPVLRYAAAFEGDGLMRFGESTQGSYPFLYGLPMNYLISFLRENSIKV